MFDLNEVQKIADIISKLASTAALAAALIYFLYRTYFGYFRVNLSTNLECERSASAEDGKDYLKVSLRLKKGDNGSLTIHDIGFRLTWGDHVETKSIDDALRLACVDHGTNRKLAAWNRTNSLSPFLKMIPGEESSFEVHFIIDQALPCRIEVVVLGTRTNSNRLGQWRCSCVSLPPSSVYTPAGDLG